MADAAETSVKVDSAKVEDSTKADAVEDSVKVDSVKVDNVKKVDAVEDSVKVETDIIVYRMHNFDSCAYAYFNTKVKHFLFIPLFDKSLSKISFKDEEHKITIKIVRNHNFLFNYVEIIRDVAFLLNFVETHLQCYEDINKSTNILKIILKTAFPRNNLNNVLKKAILSHRNKAYIEETAEWHKTYTLIKLYESNYEYFRDLQSDLFSKNKANNYKKWDDLFNVDK